LFAINHRLWYYIVLDNQEISVAGTERPRIVGRTARVRKCPKKRGKLAWTPVPCERLADERTTGIPALPFEDDQSFREIAESLSEVFWLGSVDWTQIFYVSPAYEKTLGTPCERLFQKPDSWMDHVYEPDRELVEEEFRKRVEDKDLENLQFPDFRIVRKGSIRWVSARAVPVRNPEGKIYRLAGVVEDITDRKEAELSRLAAHSMLDRIFQAIKDAVFVIDTNSYEIIACNTSVEKIFGYATNELIGRNSGVLYPSQGESVRFKEKLLAGLRMTSAFTAENCMRRKDGTLFSAEHTIAGIVNDDGCGTKLVAVIRDITGRKHAEESLRAKSKALEEYNTTLKVLLRQREEDKRELEQATAANVRDFVMPYVLKLKEGRLDDQGKISVALLEAHLREIMSPLSARAQMVTLTPKEMEVASLIKGGKTTKEMAGALGVSQRAIEFHRNQIRKRLGLTGKKSNLQSYLRSSTKPLDK
jgi:PAS domain S-box-containing protein